MKKQYFRGLDLCYNNYELFCKVGLLMDQQIKSKQRVTDHGEVFTAAREVNAMLDLVKQETERIDSTFLEPACGTGNFLVEILRRKLAVVKKNYYPRRGSCDDYELQAMKAVMSIYGVDLLQDNVDACQERLFETFDAEYKATCKSGCKDAYREVVRYVLTQNILCGNALSMMKVDDEGEDTQDFIVFPEWSFPRNDNMVKRRDFRLDVLLKENTDEDMYDTFSLFDDDAMNVDLWEEDPLTHEMIPKPIKEYSLIHYRRIAEDG